jgi:hypothetical protein
VFQLDVGDLDAPGVRLGVENALHVVVEPFPFSQHLVEFVLAHDGAQRSLREFARCLIEILDLDYRFLWVDYAIVDHGIHAN